MANLGKARDYNFTFTSNNETFMKQPPSIQSSERQGPAYDPMDRIVTALQNIQSFISVLEDNPKDLHYLESHLSSILSLRRTILSQTELLAQEPYNYSSKRIVLLKSETEKIFVQLEGLVGSLSPWNEAEFHKFVESLEALLTKFDGHLTP